MPASPQIERRALRKLMRQRRNSLSPQQQKLAAFTLRKQLSRQPLLRRSKRIAVYLSTDGEVDLMPLIEAAWARGKQVYLPVSQPHTTNRLWFVRFRRDTVLQPNIFNILEPSTASAKPLPAHCLDLVLTPLVAFDKNGARLGMGGGFYDRTFAFKRRTNSRKPYLVGIAHGCQEVESLPLESWDIPMYAIATDHKIIACGTSARDFFY